MEISFNEASLNEMFIYNKSKDQNKKAFDEFIEILNILKKEKLLSNLFIPRDFLSYYIAENYTINNWLCDHTVNMNHRQFFRACVGKANFYGVENLNGEVEFQISDNSIKGIGATFSKEHFEEPIIVSIVTHKFWEQEKVNGIYERLTDDAEVQKREIELVNIFKGFDLENYRKNKRDDIYKNISSGQDLWEKRNMLFPNLTFCESVKNQLYEDSEKYHIIKVMERLQKLQDYFVENHERYDPIEMGMNARTESETVKRNSTLKKLRLFRMPSGKEEYFFDHISFTSGKYSAGRIHFLPEVDNNNCYIGYIGNHLPTKLY